VVKRDWQDHKVNQVQMANQANKADKENQDSRDQMEGQGHRESVVLRDFQENVALQVKWVDRDPLVPQVHLVKEANLARQEKRDPLDHRVNKVCEVSLDQLGQQVHRAREVRRD